MSSLVVELIAVLLLTAIVGILMGRFLCKSKENEEKEQKQKVIYAFKISQSELEISRSKVEKQSLKVRELKDTLSKKEQQIKNVEIKLLSSEKQRVKLLDELKLQDEYQSRFESLNNEFKRQTKILEELKSQKIAGQKEITDFKILTNRLNKEISEFKQREGRLESDKTKLNRQLDQLIKTHREFNSNREKEFESLLQKNHKKYQAELESKNRAYKELKEKLEKLENAYNEYKINYNLDNDKLNSVKEENKKIYKMLETIATERENLLARLRAVSSVVGAVGVDNSGDNRQILLEK